MANEQKSPLFTDLGNGHGMKVDASDPMKRSLVARINRVLAVVDARVSRRTTFERMLAAAAHRDALLQRFDETSAALDRMTAERDGYRSACDVTLRSLGELRAALHHITLERDGYRAAGDTLSRELGELRAALYNMTMERDGYRTAGDTLSRELGEVRAALYNMTMERDGFKRAYKIVSPGSELGLASGNDPDEAVSAQDRDAAIPGILVLSLPKSGTVYINGLLTSGLGVPGYPVSLGYFPSDTLILGRLRRLARGGLVSSEHSDASTLNLWALAAYLKRWVVHVRDPRSVVLSWTHHVERYAGSIDDALRDEIYGPGYAERSFPDKLSTMIECFLPHAVAWVESWLRAVDSGKYRILLTTFDELAGNEAALIERVLKFYEIPASRYQAPRLQRTVEGSNFRSGLSDEWRTVFTADQIARANALIGERLMRRLGWPES